MLQHVAACCSMLQHVAACCSMLQHVAACCSVLQCVEVQQCVAVCCSVLQCVAVCCSVLQCVAVRRSVRCTSDSNDTALARPDFLDIRLDLFVNRVLHRDEKHWHQAGVFMCWCVVVMSESHYPCVFNVMS